MMKENKLVKRNVANALGIVCIMLSVVFAGTLAYHLITTRDKDLSYETYVSSHHCTDYDYTTLNSTYYTYMANHFHSNDAYDNYVINHQYTNTDYYIVTNENGNLKQAQLAEVNLKWDFSEPWTGHYVHIYGAIFNTGTNTAYSVNINIRLYESNVLIKSSTISLGSIAGKAYTNLDTTLDYSGHCDSYTHQTTHD